MVCLNIAAQLLCAMLFAVKVNCAVAGYRQEEKSFKNLAAPLGLILGAVWLLLTLAATLVFELPGYCIQFADVIVTLVMIAVVDVKHHIIPNVITLSLLFSQLLYLFFVSLASLDRLNAVFSVAVLLVLMLVSRMSKEQLGMGDVKLIAALNLIYGLSFTIYALLFSMIIMLLFSIPLMIMKKLNLKSQLPFAPFYVIGVTACVILNLI